MAARRGGLERASQARTVLPVSLNSIIRGFLGDLHVVHMRLAYARRSDFDEFGTTAHLVDRRAAAIAHRGPYSAHELMDHCRQRALVRHAALDALGHELFGRVVTLGVLEIAVAGALLHRPQRSHAAVDLV